VAICDGNDVGRRKIGEERVKLSLRCPTQVGELRRLTNRWSGRVRDKVPRSYAGVRAAQLSR
jgi:hypothetical protein